MTNTTTITSKGQVTIPIRIRRALGLKPRDRVIFEFVDGVTTVRKADSVVDRVAGSVHWSGGKIDFRKVRREFEDSMATDVASSLIPDENA